LARPKGFEPLTLGLENRCSGTPLILFYYIPHICDG